MESLKSKILKIIVKFQTWNTIPINGFFFVKYHATTIHKIFETRSSFHVKQRTTGKVQFPFFNSFLLVLAKFSFWEVDWALGYNFMKF